MDEDARGRHSGSRGWVRLDDKPFVDTVDDLNEGRIYYPVAFDENGARPSRGVATGTTALLEQAGGTCDDYTTSSGTLDAVGDPQDGTTRWTDLTTGRCDQVLHIYCFGTGLTRPIDPLPLPLGARLAFVTDGAITGAMGVMGMDGLCGDEASAAGLTGSFRAFVAPSSTVSALSRFVDGEPWYRLDGVPVAASLGEIEAASLTAPVTATPTRAYRNGRVWSGAIAPDAPGGASCNDWSSGGILLGRAGHSGSTHAFFGSASSGCIAPWPLLCFQE